MKYSLETFRGDFFGGLTSMVVMLPIALGFGIASGMGAAAGLYGAIATGFFAAVFGGTRTQISGPTAPMTVIMAVVITSHASNLAEALAIVVLAGFLQILLGLSRIGRFVAYTPHIVISGFMSGIGLIIVLMQLVPIFGAPAAEGGAVGALLALPEVLGDIDTAALVIGAVTVFAGFAWPRKLWRFAPGPLVALVAGTLAGLLWFTEAPTIGAIPTGLPSVQFELPPVEFLAEVFEPAIILALLGSVESLLASLVADSLTGNRHNPDRELIGQGVGNMAAGMIGALPGTGSVVATVANTRSGAKTPVAGVVCAALLLILVLGLGGLAEPIPLAALAGVLIKVGWDTIDWRLIVRIHRLRREYLVVFLTTLLLTVTIDLISAVAIGLIAAGWVHARRLEKLELDSVLSVPVLDSKFFEGDEDFAADPLSARVGLVAMRGTLSVASSYKLSNIIGQDIKDHEVVIFDFTGTNYIDDSASTVIKQLFGIATGSGTGCIVLGLQEDVASILHSFDILEDVPPKRIVATMDEARELARKILRPRPAPQAQADT